MNLKKMLLAASMALAVVAFAAPAAQGQLLYEKGPKGEHNALAVGAEVTATGIDITTETPFGKLACTEVTIHAEVEKNTATSSELEDVATTVNGCNVPITNPTAGTITIGAGTGIATGVTFLADLSPQLQCDYTGSVNFTYNTNTDLLTIAANTLVGHPVANCGHGVMSGSFTLETSNGTAVFIT